MDTKTAILAAGGGQTYFYFNGINCLFARMVYNLGMKERNYGIDFLRLVSMLFVVILHTLLISKLLVRDGESGEVHMSAWLLETLCYGAVDIFALISGYVGFREKEKPFK